MVKGKPVFAMRSGLEARFPDGSGKSSAIPQPGLDRATARCARLRSSIEERTDHAPDFPSRWLRAIPARLAESDARHRAEHRLAAVPDHLLADMGLTRDDVRAVGFTHRQ